jgi:hypothetical protein
MEYIPGISVLIALLLLVTVFMWRLDAPRIAKLLEGRGFMLLSVLLISGLLLVANLFRPEAWTADVLKVLLGVVVGLATTFSAKQTSKDAGGQSVSGSTFGDGAKIAGHDINETIEKLEAQVSEIRDSVINQVSPSGTGRSGEEYLINIIYERGTQEIFRAVEAVTGHWIGEGWELKSVTSDYTGIDGMILLFGRPSLDTPGQFSYYHGSHMEPERP